MAHLAAALFFAGLLVALGMILEANVRAHWPLISAALFGPPAPFRKARAPRRRARRSAAA